MFSIQLNLNSIKKKIQKLISVWISRWNWWIHWANVWLCWRISEVIFSRMWLAWTRRDCCGRKPCLPTSRSMRSGITRSTKRTRSGGGFAGLTAWCTPIRPWSLPSEKYVAKPSLDSTNYSFIISYYR